MELGMKDFLWDSHIIHFDKMTAPLEMNQNEAREDINERLSQSLTENGLGEREVEVLLGKSDLHIVGYANPLFKLILIDNNIAKNQNVECLLLHEFFHYRICKIFYL